MGKMGFNYEDDEAPKQSDKTKSFLDSLKGDPALGFNSPIKMEALNNDLRLKDMATYAVTEGGTILIKAITPEEVYEFTANLQKKFTEYKQLIKKGSFTIDNLEDTVFQKYGAIPKINIKGEDK